MSNYKQRLNIYTKMFSFMIKYGIPDLPTPLGTICRNLDIELVPLSRIKRDNNLRERQIFSIWGNDNGHLMHCHTKKDKYEFKIAYNDSFTHKDRKKFTIAEELAHMILGHYSEEMYNIFKTYNWDEKKYKEHEKEARIGAGILICPPPVFYNVPSLLSVAQIQEICGISRPCADMRYIALRKYKSEMERHPLYKGLCIKYDNYINHLTLTSLEGKVFTAAKEKVECSERCAT